MSETRLCFLMLAQYVRFHYDMVLVVVVFCFSSKGDENNIASCNRQAGRQ